MTSSVFHGGVSFVNGKAQCKYLQGKHVALTLVTLLNILIGFPYKIPLSIWQALLDCVCCYIISVPFLHYLYHTMTSTACKVCPFTALFNT